MQIPIHFLCGKVSNMKNKKKGVTLVELIAVIAIFALVISAIWTSLESGQRIYMDGIKRDNLQRDGKRALRQMTGDLKNCRSYASTDDMKNERFNKVLFKDGSNAAGKITYIEGYDNKRIMYAIKDTGKSKELHRIEFSDLQQFKYKPLKNDGGVIVEEKMSDYEVSNIDKNYIENKVAYNNEFMSEALPGDYVPKNFLYESYGDKCFLWAAKSDGDYKVYLQKVDNDDFKVIKDEVVSAFIDEVVMKSSGNKCDIYFKMKDRDKTREFNTSVFIVNHDGIR